MPEAIADARMTAPVGSSVTFQHTTMDVQQPWPLLSADDLTFVIACKPQAPQGSRWRDFWRRHLQQNESAATDGFRRGVLSPHPFISLTRALRKL